MSIIESIIDPVELDSQTSLTFTNKKERLVENNIEDRLMQMPKVQKESEYTENQNVIKKSSYELFLNKFLTSKEDIKEELNNNKQLNLYNAFNDAILENDNLSSHDEAIIEDTDNIKEQAENILENAEDEHKINNDNSVIQETLDINKNPNPDIFDSSIQDNNKISQDDEPIYVMKVELEKGNFQSIKIYSYTKPEELAYEFCKQHSLDINSLNYLTEEITNLLKLGMENITQSQRNELYKRLMKNIKINLLQIFKLVRIAQRYFL
jgi:hypothetical protein